MRIAIVHDDLMRRGGGEQVALSFCKAFPKATLYTLCYQPNLTYPEFRNYNIKTSWFNRVVRTEEQMKRRFFPLGIWAMKGFDFSEYDVVLISSTFCGKYIKVPSTTKVILYCHTPFRLAWYPETYSVIERATYLKRKAYDAVTYYLRHIDNKYARRADLFIANSEEVVARIRKCYGVKKQIEVVFPPVKMENFYSVKHSDDYYLVVSRFQPYKKVDLVIQAFNELPCKKLVIVGSGDDETKLRAMAGPNIEFKKGIQKDELAQLYAHCKAFLFPQYEDFGITALEANASGRPVIAYGAGGVLETMLPHTENEKPFTAIFFQEQTKDCLKNAIEKFESIEHLVDPDQIRRHAANFEEGAFIKNIQKFVQQIFLV